MPRGHSDRSALLALVDRISTAAMVTVVAIGLTLAAIIQPAVRPAPRRRGPRRRPGPSPPRPPRPAGGPAGRVALPAPPASPGVPRAAPATVVPEAERAGLARFGGTAPAPAETGLMLPWRTGQS